MRFHDPLLKSSVLLVGLAASACFPELGDYVPADGGATSSTGGGATSAGGGSQGGGGTGGGGTGGASSAGGGGALPDPTCADITRNGSETGVDCGGDACPPCGLGRLCETDGDCASGNCAGTTCGPPLAPTCQTLDPLNPSCADCELNGSETDQDCGGGECWPCGDGAACLIDADCDSGNCDVLVCVPPDDPPTCPSEDPDNPTCADCVQNGGETAVDCGGDACGPCADMATCLVHADCLSGNCAAGACAAPGAPACPAIDPDNPTCADCTKNGSETDKDCGGGECWPCKLGEDCVIDADCTSGHCGGSAGCVAM